jgi:hypothetical protein
MELSTAPLQVFQLRFMLFGQKASLPRTLFEKKGIVRRAPKEVLHKLQFFVELLHIGVCGAVPNTPPEIPFF